MTIFSESPVDASASVALAWVRPTSDGTATVPASVDTAAMAIPPPTSASRMAAITV